MTDDPSWTLSDREVRHDIAGQPIGRWAVVAVALSIALLLYLVGMVWVVLTSPTHEASTLDSGTLT